MNDQELIGLFQAYLRDEKKASSNTQSSYLRDVRHLSNYLAVNSKQLSNASDNDLKKYISFVRLRGISNSTVLRKIAAVKCFYSFLCFNQILFDNPASKLKCIKPERKPPVFLTYSEIELLLSQPECIDAKGYRDKALLEFLYSTGIRVSELVTLNCSDVNLHSGFIRCMTNGKFRQVPLNDTAVRYLEYYISYVRPQLVSDNKNDTLFVNMNGSRMTRQGIWKNIKHYASKAGINKVITPHTLRHSFAVHLIENGADIEIVKDIMGYADINSIQYYSMLARRKIKTDYLKSHPRY